ncbi:MAG TPA: biopolymer transporter ExbD [Pyrinomonadaceae bacterium]|nr:biopolymer transporter ExbD [Pyrinomonadaceae bacterium]
MGMSSGGGGSTSAQPNINVTPLIDILLVLLIIFMVITPLKPARFKTLVPEKSDELSEAAKMSPRTLTVAINKDLTVKLSRGVDLIAEGSVNDTNPIAQQLALEFKNRRETNDWRPGYENRPELPADDRIEKTVFIRAPQSFKYGEVVKVIDAVKGAGANPVGLQTELLEP